MSKLGLWVGYSLTQYYFFLSCLLNCCIKTSHSLLNISTLVISIVMSHLMVRFSITSGKVSSSAFSSSNVMEPLLSLSADSNSASVRSSSFSSGSEIALSRRQDFRTVRNSSGSMEPLPTWLDSIKNNASYVFLDQHSLLFLNPGTTFQSVNAVIVTHDMVRNVFPGTTGYRNGSTTCSRLRFDHFIS